MQNTTMFTFRFGRLPWCNASHIVLHHSLQPPKLRQSHNQITCLINAPIVCLGAEHHTLGSRPTNDTNDRSKPKSPLHTRVHVLSHCGKMHRTVSKSFSPSQLAMLVQCTQCILQVH